MSSSMSKLLTRLHSNRLRPLSLAPVARLLHPQVAAMMELPPPGAASSDVSRAPRRRVEPPAPGAAAGDPGDGSSDHLRRRGLGRLRAGAGRGALRARGYAKNLDEDDFRLLVDGKQVDIESFERRAEAPACVVVLQDLSGSMATGGKLEASQRGGALLPRQGPARATSSRSPPSRGGEMPGRRAVHRQGRRRARGGRELGGLRHHGAPRRGGLDAADLARADRNPKRFAILVTDGVDNASPSRRSRPRRLVREAQLPVYVLGLGSGSPFELSRRGREDLPLRRRAEPAGPR